MPLRLSAALALLVFSLLLTASNPVAAKQPQILPKYLNALGSENPPNPTVCQLRFTLTGWSAFYKAASGSGTLTCDNGQTSKVTLDAKGGGLTAGRSAVRDGSGKFSEVTDIGELFGTYVAAPSGGTMIMKKGEVQLALTGKGMAFDSGISFGKFTITKR